MPSCNCIVLLLSDPNVFPLLTFQAPGNDNDAAWVLQGKFKPTEDQPLYRHADLEHMRCAGGRESTG